MEVLKNDENRWRHVGQSIKNLAANHMKKGGVAKGIGHPCIYLQIMLRSEGRVKGMGQR
jgi:hypothetical protein